MKGTLIRNGEEEMDYLHTVKRVLGKLQTNAITKIRHIIRV